MCVRVMSVRSSSKKDTDAYKKIVCVWGGGRVMRVFCFSHSLFVEVAASVVLIFCLLVGGRTDRCS